MITEQDKVKEIIRLLDESAAKLDPEMVNQLAVARSKAAAAHAAQAQLTAATAGGFMQVFGNYFQHHRAMISTALVCGVVLVALIITQQFTSNEMGQYGDASLLGSDLPPEAYLDKGFDAWLENSSQR